MASPINLEALGGKTTSIMAMSRDDFVDQLNANVKASISKPKLSYLSSSAPALMMTIMLKGYKRVMPSRLLLSMLLESGFFYPESFVYADSAHFPLSILRSADYYLFSQDGVPASSSYVTLDDLLYGTGVDHFYYLVIAFKSTNGYWVNKSGKGDVKYYADCKTMVLGKDFVSAIGRKFRCLASLQWYEDADIAPIGILNSNPSSGFIRLSPMEDAVRLCYDAPIKDDDYHKEIISNINFLVGMHYQANLLGYADDSKAYAGTVVKALNSDLRHYIKEEPVPYVHYFDTLLKENFTDITDVSEQVIARLVSRPVQILKRLLDSERAFMESMTGFKYAQAPGVADGALTAAITAAFMMTLLGDNSSEIFMTNVPYGPKDPTTNGDMNLQGYINGQVWMSKRNNDSLTHEFFRAIDSDLYFSEMRCTTRGNFRRHDVYSIVEDGKVYGKRLIVSQNEMSDEYVCDDSLYELKECLEGRDFLRPSYWSITHGHKILGIVNQSEADDVYALTNVGIQDSDMKSERDWTEVALSTAENWEEKNLGILKQHQFK